MGDTPSGGNDRLGLYHLGRRSWYLGRHLGHLHEAHNLQTGAFGVVLSPDRATAWSSHSAWTVRVTSAVAPSFLSLEVEHAPGGRAPSRLELMLAFDRLHLSVPGKPLRSPTGPALGLYPAPASAHSMKRMEAHQSRSSLAGGSVPSGSPVA